ncbi:mitogen-activated protein kinase kinase kinase 3 [Selaginella moellendorffii]|uniref:mitogen-activated protein kinase kinase kinase 3 n=1 Tax=Selaginella moellendorffii TaxID=88036 RepID=UPI000D1C8A50|nr:mitogen-activated protein kinase kinase kinase 3 [Selaginella moellendorffii]|eukprot:XP_024532993.1 mitogen-activated protein kinase kinase kinase 3 [Selaginella moellendorffii]
METLEIPLQKSPGVPACWKKGALIGSGSFGNVYVGFDSYIGRFCAIKEAMISCSDYRSQECCKQLRQEIAMLSRLRHPNIVQYYGSESMKDRLHIYLEFLSGGSIQKLLHEYGAFEEPVIKSYTRQIVCGLAYLHSKQTVHRDIKGANVLIDSDGNVKLADFGMAKHVTAKSFARSLKGSPYWMAPEILKSRCSGYDLSVDIWSLGCTVIEMAQARPPWSDYEAVPVLYKLATTLETPRVPDFLSDQAKDFLRLCLQRDPSHRPTASQLFFHPWFTANHFQHSYEPQLAQVETVA